MTRRAQSAIRLPAAAPVLGVKPRTPCRAPESAVQAAALSALRYHRAVAWAERMNVGAMRVEARTGHRFIRFGRPGMADITGQMKDGRRLEVEVKGRGGRLSAEQADYLAMVVLHGGVAFAVWSVDDVMDYLAKFDCAAEPQDAIAHAERWALDHCS